MYNDTVTLFNRCGSRSGAVWYPTVIHNVNVRADRAAIFAKYGAESQDNAILNVRYRIETGEGGGQIMVGDKPWLPPKEWRAQDDAAKAASVTFAPGAEFDFFILGEWSGGSAAESGTDTIPDADFKNDGGFYGYMNKMHDYVFVVTSVSRYTVIPHFEITGK